MVEDYYYTCVYYKVCIALPKRETKLQNNMKLLKAE